jgi:uroporphyrinogen-III synthase
MLSGMPLRPLDGFVIGVTADRRAAEQAELLARRGATVVHGPTISTEYLAGDEALRCATAQVIVQRPSFLVATTGIGVRAWFEAAQVWGMADDLLDALEGTRIAARGPKAAAALSSMGLQAEFTAESEQLDETLALLDPATLRGAVVAFQHFGERRADAVEALAACDATVLEIPVYRWRLPENDTSAARLLDGVVHGNVDAVTFTSAPAVTNFLAIAEHHGITDDVLAACNDGRVVVACIGPVCAASAHAAGFENAIAPGKGRLGLLVRSVTDELQSRRVVVRLAGHDVTVQGRAIVVDGTVHELAPRERSLFESLLRRRGAVVSKATLLRTVWGDDSDPHAVETAIARLRRRLGPAGGAIHQVRGRGYRIDIE